MSALRLLALFATLTALPAAASEPVFGGWAESYYTGTSENPIFHELDGSIVGAFDVGATRMELETTLLPDVTAAFGGTIMEQGEAGGHLLWVCYVTGATRVWFVADGEMGGPEHQLTEIAIDPSDADNASYGCIDAPANFGVPAFDVPGLGAPVAELKTRFGVSTPDDLGHIDYMGNRPLGDGTPMIVYQSLSYRTENGTVTGLALSQDTLD